nr:hypothetical protein [Tanacetum cinerariifolium]
LGCLFCVGVSNGNRGECGEYGGVKGTVGRRNSCRLAGKKVGEEQCLFKSWGKTGMEV